MQLLGLVADPDKGPVPEAWHPLALAAELFLCCVYGISQAAVWAGHAIFKYILLVRD